MSSCCGTLTALRVLINILDAATPVTTLHHVVIREYSSGGPYCHINTFARYTATFLLPCKLQVPKNWDKNGNLHSKVQNWIHKQHLNKVFSILCGLARWWKEPISLNWFVAGENKDDKVKQENGYTIAAMRDVHMDWNDIAHQIAKNVGDTRLKQKGTPGIIIADFPSVCRPS